MPAQCWLHIAKPLCAWSLFLLVSCSDETQKVFEKIESIRTTQGEGISNLIRVNNHFEIKEADEIISHMGFITDLSSGLIHFTTKLKPVPVNTDVSPSLTLLSEGAVRYRSLARIHENIEPTPGRGARSEVSFSVHKDLIEESRLTIQLYPGTERMVTYSISLQAATFCDRDSSGKLRKRTYSEYLSGESL